MSEPAWWQRGAIHPIYPRSFADGDVAVQGLIVEAALTRRRAPVHHAAMLDPHTAAELPLDEIAALVDALLEADDDMIPEHAP